MACLLPVSILSWLNNGNHSCDAKLRKQTLSKKCERHGLCGYWYLEFSRIHFVFANLQRPCSIRLVYGIRYCCYYRFGLAHFLACYDPVGKIWISSGRSWRWGWRPGWRITRSWCWKRWLCWYSCTRLWETNRDSRWVNFRGWWGVWKIDPQRFCCTQSCQKGFSERILSWSGWLGGNRWLWGGRFPQRLYLLRIKIWVGYWYPCRQ